MLGYQILLSSLAGRVALSLQAEWGSLAERLRHGLGFFVLSNEQCLGAKGLRAVRHQRVDQSVICSRMES